MIRLRTAFVAMLALGVTRSGADESGVVPRQSVVFEGHETEVTDLVFTPDGRRVISGSLKNDHIWDPTTGRSTGHVTDQRSDAVALSPDGKLVAVSGFQRLVVLHLEDRREVMRIDVSPMDYSPPSFPAITFSPDGRQLVTVGRATRARAVDGGRLGLVQSWDVATGREVQRFEGLSIGDFPVAIRGFFSIAFSPDGRHLAAGTSGSGGEVPRSAEIRVWTVETREHLRTMRILESVEPGGNPASVNDLVFSPDGKQLASAHSDGHVRLWDWQKGTLASQLEKHRGGALTTRFSADGRRLASAGADRTVRIWDAKSAKAIGETPFDVRWVNSVAFSPDGKLLVAGGGDFLRSGRIAVWTLSEK